MNLDIVKNSSVWGIYGNYQLKITSIFGWHEFKKIAILSWSNNLIQTWLQGLVKSGSGRSSTSSSTLLLSSERVGAHGSIVPQLGAVRVLALEGRMSDLGLSRGISGLANGATEGDLSLAWVAADWGEEFMFKSTSEVRVDRTPVISGPSLAVQSMLSQNSNSILLSFSSNLGLAISACWCPCS